MPRGKGSTEGRLLKTVTKTTWCKWCKRRISRQQLKCSLCQTYVHSWTNLDCSSPWVSGPGCCSWSHSQTRCRGLQSTSQWGISGFRKWLDNSYLEQASIYNKQLNELAGLLVVKFWQSSGSYLYFPLVNPFVIFLQHHLPQLLVFLLQSLQHALVFELWNKVEVELPTVNKSKGKLVLPPGGRTANMNCLTQRLSKSFFSFLFLGEKKLIQMTINLTNSTIMLFNFTQYAVPEYAAALPEVGQPFLCLMTKR